MQVNISITPRHSEKLNRLVAKLGIGKSEIIRRAIDALEEKEAARDKGIREAGI